MPFSYTSTQTPSVSELSFTLSSVTFSSSPQIKSTGWVEVDPSTALKQLKQQGLSVFLLAFLASLVLFSVVAASGNLVHAAVHLLLWSTPPLSLVCCTLLVGLCYCPQLGSFLKLGKSHFTIFLCCHGQSPASFQPSKSSCDFVSSPNTFTNLLLDSSPSSFFKIQHSPIQIFPSKLFQLHLQSKTRHE